MQGHPGGYGCRKDTLVWSNIEEYTHHGRKDMDKNIDREQDENVCKWGSGLLKSRLCFLTSKNHKQDYKQRGTTTWG